MVGRSPYKAHGAACEFMCYQVADGARYAVWQGTVVMSAAPGVGCTHLVGPLGGVDVWYRQVPVKRGGQLTVLTVQLVVVPAGHQHCDAVVCSGSLSAWRADGPPFVRCWQIPYTCCMYVWLYSFGPLPEPSPVPFRRQSWSRQARISHPSRCTDRRNQLRQRIGHDERAGLQFSLPQPGPHHQKKNSSRRIHRTQAAPLSWLPTITLPRRNQIRGDCTGELTSIGPPDAAFASPQVLIKTPRDSH